MNNSIRHAVSKQTGATTYAFRADRAQWKVQCLSHGPETTVANRGIAWTTSSHPALFCSKCKSIAAGKATRIDTGRLPIATASKKRATPTATKSVATNATTKPARVKPATTSRKAAVKKAS